MDTMVFMAKQRGMALAFGLAEQLGGCARAGTRVQHLKLVCVFFQTSSGFIEQVDKLSATIT